MIERSLAFTVRAGFAPRNRLLGDLPAEVLSSLRPHLKLLSLARGRVLFEAEAALTHVYFVEVGAVSLVAVFEDGTNAEMATVGREGLVGIGSLLGGKRTVGRYVVSLPGCALALEAHRFQRTLGENPRLRAACEVFAQDFVANLLQNVACNASHSVEQRCSRWLLMCNDQVEGDSFELTHEYLADMLGVRRSSVTVVATALQNAHLIRYRRGVITVLDRRGLEAVACECYRIVRDVYDRSLTPSPLRLQL